MSVYVDNELEEWLREHWRKDNHPKYRHLYDEWRANISQNQVDAFTHQMYNEKNSVIQQGIDRMKKV